MDKGAWITGPLLVILGSDVNWRFAIRYATFNQSGNIGLNTTTAFGNGAEFADPPNLSLPRRNLTSPLVA